MMLLEPSTLASAIRVIAETLQVDYQVDPAPVFRDAGLRLDESVLAGDRFPTRKVRKLWELAIAVTGDPTFGLKAGRRVRPASFHALGFSWLACGTLREALERLGRYYRVLTTGPIHVRLVERDDTVVLEIREDDPAARALDVAIDAFLMSTLVLCQEVAGAAFRPRQVAFARPALVNPPVYAAAFGAPVSAGAECHAMVFSQGDLDAPLPVSNPDVLRATDAVAERYLEQLSPQAVATAVRRLLVQLLSSGSADQADVARRLNVSASTLQRQLRAEGTSFRNVFDSTRRSLADAYLGEGVLSHAEIAYLLGFSDQSSFSRAYRRWAGTTPRAFRSRRRPA
jgi:AraC-like DNA-binding protein